MNSLLSIKFINKKNKKLLKNSKIRFTVFKDQEKGIIFIQTRMQELAYYLILGITNLKTLQANLSNILFKVKQMPSFSVALLP